MVLDGGVDPQERRAAWHSAHRRILFATPQAFKNDVCRGAATDLCSEKSCFVHNHLDAQGCPACMDGHPLHWPHATAADFPVNLLLWECMNTVALRRSVLCTVLLQHA